MKSLLESITMVNESGFDGVIDNIKALFCYDQLSNIERMRLQKYSNLIMMMKYMELS